MKETLSDGTILIYNEENRIADVAFCRACVDSGDVHHAICRGYGTFCRHVPTQWEDEAAGKKG